VIPHLTVIRPADATETAEAWRVAVQQRKAPTVLVFTRQAVPTLDRQVYAPASGLQRGAYVLADLGGKEPQLILMASGSEVSLIIEAGERLAAEGVGVRLVSFPSWELFKQQDEAYRQSVLPPAITARLAVEAGVGQGGERWVGDRGEILSIEKFGASAPYKTIYKEYGLTSEAVIACSRKLLVA